MLLLGYDWSSYWKSFNRNGEVIESHIIITRSIKPGGRLWFAWPLGLETVHDGGI